jgi:putative protease
MQWACGKRAILQARGRRRARRLNTLPGTTRWRACPPFWCWCRNAGPSQPSPHRSLGAFSLEGQYAPRVARHGGRRPACQLRMRPQVYELGAKRVILARELSLEEIRVLKEEVPKELKWLRSFTAPCASPSGPVPLSHYMTGRDSNRGACAQPCSYKVCVMEEKRPRGSIPVSRMKRGRLFSSRDLCMIGHVTNSWTRGDCSRSWDGGSRPITQPSSRTPTARGRRGGFRRALDPVWRGELI